MPSSTMPFFGQPDREAPANIVFAWLLRLRWGALACQVVLILIVRLAFGMEMPVGVVAAIIFFGGVSNIFFHFLRKRRAVISAWLFGLIMFLDVFLLTALLYYTGGPMNPFTFLYLVHIVLGAMLMRPGWAWSLTIFTVCCYASFFIQEWFFPGSSVDVAAQSRAICHDPLIGTPLLVDMHLQGMWVAFSVTAFFIVFFVGRIQRALEAHQQTLVSLQDEQIKGEKLASLATLAAGAAHEFSTPLSTIAVAAGEMLRFLKKHGGPQALIEDTVLIRKQIDRCKEILYQMSADAGAHLGEAIDEVGVQEMVDDILTRFYRECNVKVNYIDEVGDLRIRMASRSLKRIVRGLLKNGLDASGPESPLTLRCWTDECNLFFEVGDAGSGMDEDTLSKACDPFFTTKEPGKGLGLGLYLARSVARRFGGDVFFRSTPGKGTTATLSLALEQIRPLPPGSEEA